MTTRPTTVFGKKLSKKKYRAKREYFNDLLGKAKNSEDRREIWKVIWKGQEKKSVPPQDGHWRSNQYQP